MGLGRAQLLTMAKTEKRHAAIKAAAAVAANITNEASNERHADGAVSKKKRVASRYWTPEVKNTRHTTWRLCASLNEHCRVKLTPANVIIP